MQSGPKAWVYLGFLEDVLHVFGLSSFYPDKLILYDEPNSYWILL